MVYLNVMTTELYIRERTLTTLQRDLHRDMLCNIIAGFDRICLIRSLNSIVTSSSQVPEE